MVRNAANADCENFWMGGNGSYAQTWCIDSPVNCIVQVIITITH